MPKRSAKFPPPPATLPDEQVLAFVDLDRLVSALDPDAQISLDGLRLMGRMCLMACQTNPVTDMFAMDVVDHVTEVFTLIAKLEASTTVGALLHVHKDDTHPLGPQVLDDAVEGLLNQIKHVRVHLTKQMALLQQLPPPGTILS